MPNDALLQAGLTAARAGDIETAVVLFVRLVKQDPSSEQGWLGLGFCFSDPSQRAYCFRRVLAINPDNPQAKQALELLENPILPSSPAVSLPVIPVPENSEPVQEPTPGVSPFLPGDEDLPDENEPAFMHSLQPETPSPAPAPEISSSATPPENILHEPSEPLPSLLEPSTEEIHPAEGLPKSHRKIKPLVVVLGLAILIPVLIFVAGMGYLVLSGRLASLFPASPLPTQIILPAPTRTSSPTPTVSSTVAPTLTLAPPTPTSTPAPITTLVYQPVFKTAPCWFVAPVDVSVTCGYVSVPEDRFNSATKTIQLAVAVYHATGPDPALDPVIFLQGGPGGAAVRLTSDNFDVLVKPFLAKRDFIAFDQRGTGLSIPALGCDELEKVYKQDIAGEIPISSRDYIYTNAFRSCHGSMLVGGIQLDSYTTQASSEDLKDIVTVLGYEQADLYAVSYGTRLALVTMRDHPEIVRSALLDSVVPVEVHLYNEEPLRYGASLQALFDACASDPGCNSAYPDLQKVFWDLVDKLDSNPVKVTVPLPIGSNTEYVTGSDLIGVTLGLLKTTSLIALAPGVIYKINSGDYSAFAAVQSSLPYEFEGINIGLYISVMCHEQILATTPQDLQVAMDSAHDIGRYFNLPFFGDANTLFSTCKVWGALPPAPGENAAVVSDIPTLIVEGKFDPTTPPSFGMQVADNLSHSYYLELPNAGHTPTTSDPSGCAFDTMLAFFDNPQVKPDMSCVSSINPVDFIAP